MLKRNKHWIVEVYTAKIENVMDYKTNVTVLAVTEELEIHNHNVVGQLKYEKTGHIATYFLHGEYIPAVFASQTCHWAAIETLTSHILLCWPDELSCVEKLEDCKEETDHDEGVIWNKAKNQINKRISSWLIYSRHEK